MSSTLDKKLGQLPRAFDIPAQYTLQPDLSNPRDRFYLATTTSYGHTNQGTYYGGGFPMSQQQFYPSNDRGFAYRPKNRPIRLDECDPNEVIVLTKNRIIRQQIIKVPMPESIVLQKQRIKNNNPSGCNQKHEESKNQDEEADVNQNDKLFNADKILEERRERKRKFLENMQKKIETVEREAGLLEEDIKEGERQIIEIEAINYKINKDINDHRLNNKICRLNEEISREIDRRNNEQAVSINPAMSVEQINQALDDIYQGNDELLQEIEQLKLNAQGGVSTSLNVTKDNYGKRGETKSTNKKKPESAGNKKQKTLVGFNSTVRK